MKRLFSMVICIILSISILVSCQSGDERNENNGNNEVKMSSSADRSESEESRDVQEKQYEVKSFLPLNEEEKVYHWVFLQNHRSILDEEGAQQVNARLREVGVDACVAFHMVDVNEYVTPQVLERVYDQMEGQMDFVSISPALCGLSMDEWSENFIELSDSLQEESLIRFYQTVPEKVWKSNQIADGLYSFSNSSTIYVHGFGFGKDNCDLWGRENLLKLQEANGVENEEIWKEIYELRKEPICEWTGLGWGYPVNESKEKAYMRNVLSKIANGWERLYYVYLTDDIRFNIDKNEFEWLVESEIYQEVRQKTIEYYQKGYLGGIISSIMPNQYPVERLGAVLAANTVRVQKMVPSMGEDKGDLWVPSWNTARISTYERPDQYMYSCVYRKAQSGWKEILSAIGSDETISDVLNQNDVITISAVVYQELPVIFHPDIEDQYELVEMIYEEAEMDPLEGFIFNPAPIQKEWEAYNEIASRSIGINLWQEPNENGMYEANIEAIEMVWEMYQNMEKEAPIQEVVDEINRQYQAWRLRKEVIS